MEKDLLIIGGGPGGYVAAIRAAQLGRQVTLIEREELGGTCLNHGCIPTKALYKNAEVLDEFSHAEVFGVSFDGAPRLDLAAVRDRAQKVVKTLTGGVGQLLKGNGVEVIRGEAQFVDSRTVQVNGEQYTAKHILIATGSKPARLPIEGIDSPGVMDSTAALRLEDVPDHLLIIGGGVIGIEMAGIYQAFGAQVTVVEF
ncbi:MAG: FAD-dependent oxidoreductase, partial [Candidatus Hydrogenedens sp.]|nr:FAD-dependent oxidoreductase [Candidatus Hydrogenedens sp.]